MLHRLYKARGLGAPLTVAFTAAVAAAVIAPGKLPDKAMAEPQIEELGAAVRQVKVTRGKSRTFEVAAAVRHGRRGLSRHRRRAGDVRPGSLRAGKKGWDHQRLDFRQEQAGPRHSRHRSDRRCAGRRQQNTGEYRKQGDHRLQQPGAADPGRARAKRGGCRAGRCHRQGRRARASAREFDQGCRRAASAAEGAVHRGQPVRRAGFGPELVRGQ